MPDKDSQDLKIERQKFQLHKKGYEDIARAIKDKETPEVQKVSILGAELITIKGEKGEKGDLPSEEDLTPIIQKLIPDLITGKDGNHGKDGTNGKDGKNGANGKDGKKGLDGSNGKDGANGKNGSPDLPEQLVDKLLTIKKSWLPMEAIIGDFNERVDRRILKTPTGISSLKQLSDVDYSGLTQDSKGNYILGLNTGSTITLKTNDTNNSSQSILNLKQGSNITLTDDGLGGVTINSTGGGSIFTSLTDVPNSYTGQTLKAVRVNAAETGLEFFDDKDSNPKSKVYIFTGQSNSLGTSDYATDITTNSKVFVWSTASNSFIVMTPGTAPMQLASNNGGIASTNAAFYFGREMQEKTGGDVYIFMQSIPSLDITNWYNITPQYMLTDLNAQLVAAGVTYVDGIFWDQGEANDGNIPLYKTNFEGVKNYFRNATWGRYDIPIIVTGMPNDTFCSTPGFDLLDPLFQNMSFSDPFVGYANTENAPTNTIRTDDFHFNEAGQKEIAHTSAQALNAIPNTFNKKVWNMGGNSNITVYDFLGTTDLTPLNFRINNIYAGELSTLNTGFGYNGSLTGTGGTYFGGYSRAALDATAIGFAANASFDYAVSIGNGSTANTRASIVGTYSNGAAYSSGLGYFQTLGSLSVGLGYYVKALGTNQIGIGSLASPQVNNAATFPVAGENFATDTVSLGIGTSSPTERLHVVGSVKIVDGTQGLNKVLTSDANGKASWQTPSGGSGSGITRSISTISTNTTAGGTVLTDYVYLVSGTTTITLPTAVGDTNLYTIKRTGVNTVTIATTSAQTIDGVSTQTLLTQYESMSFISDGSNWLIT